MEKRERERERAREFARVHDTKGLVAVGQLSKAVLLLGYANHNLVALVQKLGILCILLVDAIFLPLSH